MKLPDILSSLKLSGISASKTILPTSPASFSYQIRIIEIGAPTSFIITTDMRPLISVFTHLPAFLSVMKRETRENGPANVSSSSGSKKFSSCSPNSCLIDSIGSWKAFSNRVPNALTTVHHDEIFAKKWGLTCARFGLGQICEIKTLSHLLQQFIARVTIHLGGTWFIIVSDFGLWLHSSRDLKWS